MAATTLKVFGLNCSLKSSKDSESSSTDVLMQQLFDALEKSGASGEFVRAADFNIKPGVKSDEGKGDDWPKLRKRVLAADILVIGSPIWLGQPSSIAKRVMERMDAFLDEKDERGRMPSYGKVAIAAIVGTKTARITAPQKFCQACAKSASPYRPADRPIGSARPWARRNTRISRNRRKSWRSGRKCWPQIPRIWRGC
jgi:multimeric flavodoxin WrbA